jgi:hypothetical protein
MEGIYNGGGRLETANTQFVKDFRKKDEIS